MSELGFVRRSDDNKRTPVPSSVQVLTRGAAGLSVTVLSLCLNLANYLDNLLGRVKVSVLNTNLLRVRGYHQPGVTFVHLDTK